MSGADLALAATSLVGAPFRLHGRDPASGLDCVGVLAAALARCGRVEDLPNGYALRNRVLPELAASVSGSGFVAVTGEVAAGDVLLVQSGPAQFHLLVASGGGSFIHAHAGLKRVVCSNCPPDWPVVAHWRLAS
jgi:cell wall-associated NlpC family hydrolase